MNTGTLDFLFSKTDAGDARLYLIIHIENKNYFCRKRGYLRVTCASFFLLLFGIITVPNRAAATGFELEGCCEVLK